MSKAKNLCNAADRLIDAMERALGHGGDPQTARTLECLMNRLSTFAHCREKVLESDIAATKPEKRYLKERRLDANEALQDAREVVTSLRDDLMRNCPAHRGREWNSSQLRQERDSRRGKA